MAEYDYDLIVIGSGPAGQRAAIQAAKLNKRVAIAEKKALLGGVCINTGTIPSKTLREAVLDLTGYRERDVYGASYTVKEHITAQDLLFRCDYVIRHEIDVVKLQMARNGVELINAAASFTGPHCLQLDYTDGRTTRQVSAAHIVIAVGTAPTLPPSIPVDGNRVFLSDGILQLDRIPKTLAVLGAGVIGCEYASIFAALGVRVTVIEKQPQMLTFVDREIIEMLDYHLRQSRATLRLGEIVAGVEFSENDHVRIHLASGKQVATEKALVCLGRQGATATLNLESVGLTADERGRLKVNEHYQTAVPHIYAVGDVIGFPSLASTSMEQGRLAACHAFGWPAKSVPELFPYGIYSIPEISMVGKTEEELTAANVPYEVGKAYYREIARGQIMGDHNGMLKLLFHLETRELLGIHIIGEGAAELVHIGQAVLSFGGTIDYFMATVFNYPTLAECYKVAAFDGFNRLDLQVPMPPPRDSASFQSQRQAAVPVALQGNLAERGD